MTNASMGSAYPNEMNKPSAFLFAATGIVLVVINVYLTHQNRKLKIMARRVDRPMELRAGAELPPIEGFDIAGNKLKVEHGHDPRKTILLVFSPGCRACKENMANWEALIKGVDKNSYRVIGVSLMAEGAGDYVSQSGLAGLPVIAEIDPKTRIAYNLMLTPQQILISPDGKAEKVWTGLLAGDDKEEVEKIFDVKLPASN